jgi:hypothetical protein
MHERERLAGTGVRLGLGALACGIVAVPTFFFGIGGPLEPLAVLLEFTTVVLAVVAIVVSAFGARAEPRPGALGIAIGLAAILVPFTLVSVLTVLVLFALGSGD